MHIFSHLLSTLKLWNWKLELGTWNLELEDLELETWNDDDEN
jgi:hypothetical protein